MEEEEVCGSEEEEEEEEEEEGGGGEKKGTGKVNKSSPERNYIYIYMRRHFSWRQ
jgi:hypothetical protein